MLHVFGCSYHLLHEVITIAFGHAHSHRAREADAALGIAHHFAQLSEALGHAPLDISVVSLVIGKHRFILIFLCKNGIHIFQIPLRIAIVVCLLNGIRSNLTQFYQFAVRIPNFKSRFFL